MTDPSTLTILLERLVNATERIAAALENPSSGGNGNGPNLYRDLAEYPHFDWPSIQAKVLSWDEDGATEVQHAGVVYSRRCKNGDIWLSAKTGTEDGEPTYSRLITFKVGHEIEELPKGVRRSIAASVAAMPDPPTPPAPTPISSPQSRTIVPTPTPITPASPTSDRITDNQVKRLFATGRHHGWSSDGVRQLTHSYADSTKNLTQEQFQMTLSQLATVDPNPFNAKADAEDPKRNLKRFRAIAKELGLSRKQGDELIKRAIADRYPGRKSDKLIPPEVNAVRDSILIAYGTSQLPEHYRTVAASEYLVMVGAMGDEDCPPDDSQVAQMWLEVLQGLIANAEQSQAMAVNRKDVDLSAAL